ncbi:MAG: patatin-like phospholipase family protein [Acidobacteria bacterium]|nr:patatin-like phospholipase family protein [Acidobacteriota bacterium]MCB9396309.1 patatin-like phospholipase family protein [Acidobacteriota bacterium]
MARPQIAERGLHLALGGGAARGLAHIGVLRALHEHNIPIASVCGTSMGALVGSVYALNPDVEALFQTFHDFIHGEIYNRARYSMLKNLSRQHQRDKNGLSQYLKKGVLLGRTLAFGSVVPFEAYFDEVKALLPDKGFHQTSVPFSCVACDVRQMREVIFNRGSLRSAIMASCAIPGVYPAIRTDHATYVDGSWVNVLPVRPLMDQGRTPVLGISLGLNALPTASENGLSTLINAFSASYNRLQELQIEAAPLILTPEVQDLHWADFQQLEVAVERGYACAKNQLSDIQALLYEKPKRWWEGWVERRQTAPAKPYKIPAEYRAIWEIEQEP